MTDFPDHGWRFGKAISAFYITIDDTNAIYETYFIETDSGSDENDPSSDDPTEYDETVENDTAQDDTAIDDSNASKVPLYELFLTDLRNSS